MSPARDPILSPYPPAEFLRFVELFNQQEYFEAHEILEDLWVMTPGEEREFYKGLIMLAVGLLHARSKRKRGAVGVLTGALEHLRKYPATYGGLDREQSVAVAQAILDGAAVPRKAPLIRVRSG
jgi:predicted metal-dependent hydrolase